MQALCNCEGLLDMCGSCNGTDSFSNDAAVTFRGIARLGVEQPNVATEQQSRFPQVPVLDACVEEG